MKKFFAAVPVIVLAFAALTACSSSSPSNVVITGEFGGTVQFESGYPVNDPGDKVEVVEEGNEPATSEEFIVTRRTVFNGQSGELLVTLAAVLPVEAVSEDPEWLRQVVTTTGVDQRSIIITSIREVYGPGVAEQVGLADSTPIVIVDDVLSEMSGQVKGDVQDLPAGFPNIVLADDGRPTVTIPGGNPPTELLISDRIVGDGATVTAGDDVIVQYQGTNWRTGEIFDESWGRRIPASFNTEAVVAGFKAALVGQKVGSQVVVIIPPAEGYGETGNPQAGIEGTDVLVFVIDILAAVPALPASQ